MRSRGLIRSGSMNRSFLPGSCGRSGGVGRRRQTPHPGPHPRPDPRGRSQPSPAPPTRPDLLQQVDELVPRQPLQDTEVGRLGRVTPGGGGHGGAAAGRGTPPRGRGSAGTHAPQELARRKRPESRDRAPEVPVATRKETRSGTRRIYCPVSGPSATPRSSSSRRSAASSGGLVPRRPPTTSAAHRKYSCTRSSDHPAGTRAARHFRRRARRGRGQAGGRADLWARSGAGPAGCAVCPPVSPAWPGRCCPPPAPPAVASAPPSAAFCRPSAPPPRAAPRARNAPRSRTASCPCPPPCRAAARPAGPGGAVRAGRAASPLRPPGGAVPAAPRRP